MTLLCCGCGLKTGAKIFAIFQMSLAVLTFLGSIIFLFSSGHLSSWEILLSILVVCTIIFLLGYVLYLGINQNDLLYIDIARTGYTLIAVFSISGLQNRIAAIYVEELSVVLSWIYILVVLFYCRREIKQNNKSAIIPMSVELSEENNENEISLESIQKK